MAVLRAHLKTQTVARALGLSVSTIKRWVDSGTIAAVRTVGGHRLIPTSEAIRMARNLGLDSTRLSKLAGDSSGELGTVNEHTCDQLHELLKEGKNLEAKAFIETISRCGCPAATLADQLIRPVMSRIGHCWLVGALDIFQEHQASQVVASAIIDRIGSMSSGPKPTGPLALCATSDGDPYSLSCLLAELVLREMGWDVRNLGLNLPLRSLANATAQYRPTIVVLSINYLSDRDRFVSEYLSCYETAIAANSAVILGGQALDSELRSRLRYTAFGDRMVHLAEFARQLALSPSASKARSISREKPVARFPDLPGNERT